MQPVRGPPASLCMGRRPLLLALLVLSLASLLAPLAQAVVFDLVDRSERAPPAHSREATGAPVQKCVHEEINKGVLVLGQYSAVDGLKLTVKASVWHNLIHRRRRCGNTSGGGTGRHACLLKSEGVSSGGGVDAERREAPNSAEPITPPRLFSHRSSTRRAWNSTRRGP